MKILFIRHGQTAKNISGRLHSKDDKECLDAVGIKQSKNIAQECRIQSIQSLYTSPTVRTQQTADIIGRELRIDSIVIKSLRERNWGDWSNRKWVDIQSELDKMDLEDRYNFVPPNGESWKEMDVRIKSALDKLLKDKNNTIAVVAHGGMLRALLPIIKNLPKESSFQYNLENGSITIFEEDKGEMKEIVVNSTKHLE